MPKAMRVFITGASGLIGSHLARELMDTGHEVVALCRGGSDTSFLDRIGCRIVRGDVRADPGRMVPSMAGCHQVVHTAAQVYAGGSWPKVRESNVDGTRNVLTAARLSGAEHVVHVSTVAVYGRAAPKTDEDAPIDTPIPPGDLYARSKREAEKVARGIEERRGLPVTVVRPAAVYGERDRLMVPALVSLMRWPVVALLGPGHNTLPVVYAGNVATAIRRIVEQGRGGNTFNVSRDHPLTQRGLFDGLARGLGKKPRFVSLPAGLVRVGGGLLARLGVSAPGAQHLPLERVIELGLGENPFPSTRIRETLGWDPPYLHEDALQRTGRWFREHPPR
ncbi:MAG: NAD(P)-dependent oxidoreductase [Gemmatimonadota bacterium]|nr:NAD(P)-dependent oxidoreductase [Gemmatimonadota bacterium]